MSRTVPDVGRLFTATPRVILLPCEGSHLHKMRFRPSERDLIAHYAVFDGIFQRSMKQHLYIVPLHESHLNQAFSERPVAENLHDFRFLPGLKFV